nr:hypothetical protein Iba_scaffold48388CG0010 [Ipomoea batatas]GME01856.1 hypothetical protein Iba_contig3060CG0010 [Ipomoea batatas]
MGLDGDRAGGQRRWMATLETGSGNGGSVGCGDLDEADRRWSRQCSGKRRRGNETDEENCSASARRSVHWRGLVWCVRKKSRRRRWSVLRYEEGVRFRSVGVIHFRNFSTESHFFLVLHCN